MNGTQTTKLINSVFQSSTLTSPQIFFINALTENEIIFLQNKKKRMKNWKKIKF